MAGLTLSKGAFLGKVTQRVNIGNAIFSVVRHQTERIVAEHDHELAYFSLLLDGAYEERYKDSRICFEPFSIALHPSQYRHADTIGAGGASFFTVELDSEWSEMVADFVDLQKIGVEVHGGNLTWLAVQLFRAVMGTQSPDEFDAVTLLYEMLADAARLPPPQRRFPAWLTKVCAHVEEHSCDPLTLSELAEVGSVHPVSIVRAFRVQHHQTVGQYIRRIRVQHATRLMKNPEWKLSDVAAEAGFADHSHFTRTFKEITGLRPTEFRSLIY